MRLDFTPLTLLPVIVEGVALTLLVLAPTTNCINNNLTVQYKFLPSVGPLIEDAFFVFDLLASVDAFRLVCCSDILVVMG